MQRECLKALARRLDADTAERLEEIGQALHDGARELQSQCAENMSGLQDVPSNALMDRIVAKIRVRIEYVTWLKAPNVGAWVERLRTIFIQSALTRMDRLVAIAHEIAHALRGRAPHDEIWYLTLVLLIPRGVLNELPEGRVICAGSLIEVCTWTPPYWAAEARALALSQMHEAA